MTAPLALPMLPTRASTPWQRRLLVPCLVASDLLALAAAFALAYVVRYYSGFSFFVNIEPSLPYHIGYQVFLLPVWLALFAVLGAYDERNLLGGTREYALIFNACTVGTMLAVAATFFTQRIILSRGWLVLAWFLGFGLVALSRFALRRVVYALRRRGRLLSPAVIVGAAGEGQALAHQLQEWATSGLRLVGFVDDSLPAGTRVLNGLTVLGGVDHVPSLVRLYGIEEAIVASSSLPREQLMELVRGYALSDHLRIRLSSGLFEILTTGVQVKEMGSVPLICLNKVRLNAVELVMKTLLDWALALPGLILLSPLLAVIALAVKLDSPGPVFYRRCVVGRGGRTFRALKFRTMVSNGDAVLAAHPRLQAELSNNGKLKNDPRVTRLGGFLRKWSLDELPQLWNVLRRQMSLVGPRMIGPGELEKYGKWDMNLLTVWPGLTGLWQISGRSDVAYDERVRLDMHYIRNYSIWTDLQILLRTIPAVLSRRGAY